ncbi:MULTISPECIES: hypothetical protein [Bacillus]|uniref:hypothetical protein n=1 Tax=unclassified Bacillus (in: firmicutes) TaxID=185979 RepID=UPI0012B69701|nr:MULTISPECIES: hypothetical protein [Bacillus]
MKALITGGNRGLGFELVKVFHEKGYVVFPIVRKNGCILRRETELHSKIFK